MFEKLKNILGFNKKTHTHIHYEPASMEKLDEDGELPWGWLYVNQEFIKQHDSKLSELYRLCSESTTIDDEIKKLKEFIEYYYFYKNKCHELGECFYKYFEDMHMKCFNDDKPTYELVKPKEERLTYINNNYNKLISLENKCKNMKSDIIELIKNNDGIIQSELIKSYEPELQDKVRGILYELKDENLLIREKSGRSFKLYINNNK